MSREATERDVAFTQFVAACEEIDDARVRAGIAMTKAFPIGSEVEYHHHGSGKVEKATVLKHSEISLTCNIRTHLETIRWIHATNIWVPL